MYLAHVMVTWFGRWWNHTRGTGTSVGFSGLISEQRLRRYITVSTFPRYHIGEKESTHGSIFCPADVKVDNFSNIRNLYKYFVHKFSSNNLAWKIDWFPRLRVKFYSFDVDIRRNWEQLLAFSRSNLLFGVKQVLTILEEIYDLFGFGNTRVAV